MGAKKNKLSVSGGVITICVECIVDAKTAQMLYNARDGEPLAIEITDQCNGSCCCKVRKENGTLVSHEDYSGKAYKKTSKIDVNLA